MVMMMIMMMTMIIRESVVRTRDVLEKTARSKALLVVKTELSLLCGLATAKQAPVESTILSDYTR